VGTLSHSGNGSKSAPVIENPQINTRMSSGK
jgi:hypothetical protein